MAVLAQLNVARMRADVDSPEMRAFVAALDPVHRLAAASPGFVWRLESGHAHRPVTRADDAGAVLVVNLSLWRSYEALHAFTYRGTHGALVRRGREWFLPAPRPATVLWWVPDDARPTPEDGLRRLAYLRAHGPGPRAFTTRRRYTTGGAPGTR